MDTKQPDHVYLDVPVTEAERAQAKQRPLSQPSPSPPPPSHQDDAYDRLLPDSRQHPGPSSLSPHPEGSAPTRFPSIHAPPALRPQVARPFQRFESRQYAPISPINEEDEPNSIHLREPSERIPSYDDGYLLPDAGPIPPLWTPFWLKRWVLGLFALVFMAFLIGLVLLWHYDDQNDGFEVDGESTHYAWAYSPTVLVVLLVAAWRMVDHHSKLAMPYDSLQNGPIKPSESLLVDYISSFQLVSLFQAFKNSHFAVLCSVIGFILLKVITVFATGLLVLLPSQVAQKNVSIQANGFTAASFDPRAALDSSTFAPQPVYAYYGSMAQGMPLEDGVTLNMAYGALTVDSATSIGNGSIISADVDAFVPFMTCKTLDIQLNTPTIVNDTNSASAFATSSNISFTIHSGDVCTQSSSVSVPADDPYTEILPERQVTGTMQQIYCGSTNASVPDSNGPLGVLFSITDISYQQTLFDNATDLEGGSFTIASDVSRTLNSIMNVFCKPSYNMTTVTISNDTRFLEHDQAISITPKLGATNATLRGFSDWNATNVLSQASTSAEVLFGDSSTDSTLSESSAIFTLMALTQGTKNIETLMDPDKMISAAQSTYKGVLSQYVHQNLRDTVSRNVDGATVTRQERRLRVNNVSVWSMASVCGLLVFFSLLLVFIAPRAVVPRDPSSIATMATILTRSTELNRLLRKQGPPSLHNQKSALAGYEFGTALATTDSGRTSFKIVASEGELDEPTTKPSLVFKWWLPITATIPVVVLTLILPVGVIVALEIIQRSSDKNNGFRTVADDKLTEVYSHYIPGLMMLIMAALVNMLDFNVALFAPWNNLAAGNATHRKTVLNHILGKTPPFAFVQALRTWNVGAMLSVSAAILASILTVIASGLYYVEHFTMDGAGITLRQLDTFNLEWPNSFTTDNGAAAMLDLMMHQNFGNPQFVYDGLVFPKLFLDNSALTTDALTSVSGSSSHSFPAVRGNLRCEVLGDLSYVVTTEKAGDESAFATDQAFVTATAALPDTCHLGGSLGTDGFVTYEHNFELLSGGRGTYAGAQLDLLFGQNASVYGNYGEFRGQYIGDNPAVGCPSLAFTFGHFQLGIADKSQVTTMVCFQEIQGLQANVTMKLNSTTIDPEHPPIVDEASVFLHDNPASNASVKSFDFRIQNNFAQEMTVFNGGNSTPATDPSQTATMDVFFQAIINGTEKHDPASLTGQNNQDVLIDAINSLYRQYMAQVITVNMRQPLNSSSTTSSSRLLPRQASTTNTLTTTVDTPRLVQDNASKMTLQILLGLMVALSAAAWLTTKMRRVLPCNPCSMAGTMSLLAGSDLCHNVDDGLCECCGKPRRRSFGHDNGKRPESIHMGPDEDVHGDQREQLIPDGTEWLRQSDFEDVFGGGKRYSMGWWRERRAIGKRRRFGVDVGLRADGSDDQDWELGERRPIDGFGFGDFMMRGGDRDGRGEYSRFGSAGAAGGAGGAGGDGLRGSRAASPDPSSLDQGPSASRLSGGLGGRTAERLDYRDRDSGSSEGVGGGGSGGEPGPSTLASRRPPIGGEA